MQRVHQDGGRYSDQNEGAARFAALVRCSIQEAQEWLRRSAGSIEAALDGYLAQQRSSKRHKTSATSPCPCSPHLNSAFSPVTKESSSRNSTGMGTGRHETSDGAGPGSLPVKQAKVQAAREASVGGPVLMIDLAGDSGEEDVTATSENKGHNASNPAGKLGDKGCSSVEVQPPASTDVTNAPAVDDLPNNFSFCLGECVASGTVTSGTMSRVSLTDPLTLMVEVRLPHAQRWGPQQGLRRAKVSNSGYRIVYVHLNDPILLEHQRRLGQPSFRARLPDECAFSIPAHSNAFGGMKAANGSSHCSPLAGLDFHSLLSSISEQTTFLRLLINGREAVRFDREVANALAPLLLLGAIKVDVCWMPDRMPPRRLVVNSTLSVRMTTHVTLQALRLSALRQRGDPYLSQVHFPVLIGQAFESLLNLLAMQPVAAASSPTEEENDVGASTLNEDTKIRKCLDSLNGPKGSTGLSQTGIEATGLSLSAASRAFTEENEGGEDSDDTNVFDEDDEEVAERSGTLCQLVLGERAAADQVQSPQQRRRRLGTLYPPASMFASRLRPYQAQGLWWMLQCESEQSLCLEDEEEELDPLWTKYNLPATAAACGTSGSIQPGPTLVMASSVECKPARTFVPRCFYINTSSGLVSLEKPSTTGRVRGGILADCMGLGKTVQVLALIAVSEFQERDPKGAASWLATSAGGFERNTRATSRTSSTARPASTPDKQPAAPANESDAFASSSLSPSPISVSSEGDCADLKSANPGEPPPAVGRNPLLAVDPRILQRTLKRGRDGLLQGGTLIVVPLSLIGQWYAEVQRHLVRGVATVLQYYGPGRPRDPRVLAAYTIVLTSYQTLASDFRHLSKHMQTQRGGLNREPHSTRTLGLGSMTESPIASIRFRRVILDEGHIIKNTSSLVNRACNSVEADSRWILTGTPLQNDLSDAFALIQFLRVSPMGSRRWWRAKVTQAMERAQDLLKTGGNDSLVGVPNSPPLQRPAPDPVLHKYIQDAVDGKLEDCPICLEPPTDAVVLTNCWHVLCVACVLLLQSNSNGAAAACPTCRSKFLHQHVRLLPRGPKAAAQRWIQVVQKKHREALAATDTKTGSKHEKQMAVQEAQIGAKMCSASPLTPAHPTVCVSADLKTSVAKSEEAPQKFSDDTFFFSTKMRLLLALLEADVTAGRSCVIFSQWTSMLDLLEMAFARVEAVRNTEQPRVSSATDDDDEDDDVVEVGVALGKGNLPRFLSGDLSNEVAVVGQDRPVQQAAPKKRLYNYRRIDGTLGLEARQRIIQWFSDDSLLSMASTVVPCTSRATDEEEAPFMGQFDLQPFTCTRHPTDASHGGVAPPSEQCGTAKSTSGIKGGVGISSPHHGKILLLSLKTGNVGLNLVKATRCYIVDGWWNPQVEKQAMRRLWRYGQDQPVSVYRFVCSRTVEERMEELIEWKGRLSQSTLSSGDRFERGSSVDPEEGDADKRKGRLSLHDLKKLFEGWEADSGST
ncbi:DNA repair protein, putative [Eimeria mitis]|uniref:DNA repair protein, putative n=1 Tax=Eimeria mitis TaxID=44415 RepID=U6KDM2_9EIME|nr:DNA repair protein, putative [Eimeria mitis]CDJ36054.1 DNA repair protein, putative [Eimeria mitis]